MLKAIAAALACAAVLPSPAQAPDPQPRPRVGLVLSGGGARGLAHIGVLKVLREQRVAVDFIVATSMGSIVGGAYAAGHTPEHLEALVRDADWDRIFSDRAPREFLNFRRKEDDLRLIGKSELGLKRDGLALPRGALGSQNLEEFLRSISRPASDASTLNDLPILFRAVATDLVTAEQVVLSEVTLPVAMRASMAIPGAFAPSQVDGRLLGDGGLVRNLPVEVARDMGADVIIAVNVGTPLMPRESLTSALGVAQQMINILTEQNVGISLAAMRPGDVLVSPDLTGVSFVDFDRGADLIASGEAAARRLSPRLAALALPAPQYAEWEALRTRATEQHDRPVTAVRVHGVERVNPEALKRVIAERAAVEVGGKVTEEQLVTAARVLHGSGDFERVDVRTRLDEGRRSVIVDVEEKAWGPNYLRFGGRAVSDFKTDGRFSLILQHTLTWVNSWGAEWRNEMQVGDTRRFASSFFQPLGAGSAWFAEATAQSTALDADTYERGFRRTDRFTQQTTGAYAMVGRRLGTTGVARLGVGHERYRSTPTISSRFEGTEGDRANLVRAGITFDTLDDGNFPRRGYVVTGETTTIDFRSGGERIQTYSLSSLFPVTFGRLTLLGILGTQRSRDDRGGFNLGGFLNLSGTPVGGISGSQSWVGAALAYYRMGQLPRALGSHWYTGVSLEAGNAWQRADRDHGPVRKAGSIFVGIDSIIGPLYFAYGRTAGVGGAFYLFLGRPTQ